MLKKINHCSYLAIPENEEGIYSLIKLKFFTFLGDSIWAKIKEKVY